MLLHLVKKDFLLVKRYLPLFIVLPFILPIFVMIQASQLLGLGAFLLSVIFTVFILYQSVLVAEMKYPKAESMLCATPYARITIVKARYSFLLLMFAYSGLAYYVLALFLTKIDFLTPSSFLITMLISVLLLGIYTPIQYKLGFEKTKYFFMIVIMISPFSMAIFAKSNINFDFTGFSALPMFAQYLIPIVAIIAILFTSINLSIKIYSKKELQ